MPVDPLEDDLEVNEEDTSEMAGEMDGELIARVETSTQWNDWRRDLAVQMFNEWKSHPDANGIRGKSFNHYDVLMLIFGKERAIGKMTKAAGDILEDVNKEQNDGGNDTETGDGLGDSTLHNLGDEPFREESSRKQKKSR
ncbi:uncharacterized protein LOC120013366 [Tripterygium wilfordii]|uniref:uncharacterized protein LOC120013366 n=1 Tax=Tripterygium wilfordii TaxID=458696 RepID=UPI0018F8450D|nr:uncharacterized protein LOC120013366 [Tripterygium wilfordii]XP_038721082.1 uncharacterized protein LOC120013366 [Tripterygium wilfordii]XP_038721083.1 uncharacterized protein LOC120013366 [Tripterygium wilfordii]